MSEFDEIDEFHDRVGSSGSGHSGRGSRPTQAPVAEDSEEGLKEAKDARMWAVQGPNFFPCDEAVNTVPPGQYEVLHSPNSGFFFQTKNATFDELMRLPDSASEEIYEQLEEFWQKEEHFRRFGFLWKRGILLWGPAGSGKTSTLQLISQSIVEKGGISVYVNNPSVTAQGLSILRRIEPDRPCVVMLEDLDAMISNHGEHEVLALLDGELQIDNVVFIATTNYPERLDKRIVNRPSRFDIVKLIGMPNSSAREMYLSRKNKRLIEAVVKCKTCGGTGLKNVTLDCDCCDASGKIVTQKARKAVKGIEGVKAVKALPEISETCSKCVNGKQTHQDKCSTCAGEGGALELALWVKETEGFSIAHLKELIVSVEVFEIPLETAIKRLRHMMEYHPKSTDSDAAGKKGIGDYR